MPREEGAHAATVSSSPRALLIDLDGVIYHGSHPLPDAHWFLSRISHRPHLFLTNNPIRTPVEVVEHFRSIGLPVPQPEQVLTSAEATAAWLVLQKPDFTYFAVGALGLHRALEAVGRPDAEQADFVVVGEGPGLDFDSLTCGINLVIQRGAKLVVTNPDTTVDSSLDGRHRVLPGGGALVAPFVAATGCEPIVIGKPEPGLFRMALARLGYAPAETLMIGDRPDTDIAGAARLGLKTALVRTGRFAPGAPWPVTIPPPDWDVLSLTELLMALGWE